jgi:DNA mismatch repair protein MutS
VLERARHVLKLLEGEQLAKGKRVNGSEKAEAPQDQLGLFAHAPNPVINRLAALDTDSITPLQALSLLAELSRDAKRF